MNEVQLIKALWRCKTKEDFLDVLRRIPHKLLPIDGKTNNSSSIELATNPYTAFIEGVTNAWDAIITDWHEQRRFPKKPDNVIDALTYIEDNSGRPLVHVFWQKTGKEASQRIMSICDEGSGMTEDGMRQGVLAIGSESKTQEPMLHGNYGHGGSSLYGQSRASLIATRIRGSDHYLFTAVYKIEPEDETQKSYYVYACNPDGSLFRAAAKSLDFTRPGSSADHKATMADTMILPEHGTIRRQYEMKVEYFTGAKSTSPTLYSSLSDKLFGSPATVRLIGDNDKASNTRRGRRHMLNAIEVGGSLRRTGAKMLCKIAPIPVMVYDGKIPMGTISIGAWVVQPWHKPDDKKPKTAVLTMLESASNTPGTHLGILATLNTQLHGRIRSHVPMKAAGLNNIVSHTIIEVSMNGLNRAARSKAIASNRTQLHDDFEKKVIDEVTKFLKAHDELAEVNDKMEVSVKEVQSKDIQKILDELMNDPLLGLLSGTDTIGANGQYNDGGMTNKAGQEAHGKIERIIAPFEPVDPPTLLEIHKSTIRRNRTEWVTIVTNAPTSYASKIKLDLPDFMKVVPGAKVIMRKGRITFPTIVVAGTSIGAEGDMVATLALPDGTHLKAEKTITVVTAVVPEEAEKPPVNNVVQEPTKGQQHAAFPKTQEIPIDGYKDDRYSSFFYETDEKAAAFAYGLSKDGLELEIYVNTQFEMNDLVKKAVAKYRGDAEVIAHDFSVAIKTWRAAVVSVLYRQNVECDEKAVMLLSALSRSAAALIMKRYEDVQYKRLLVSRSTEVAAES